MEERDKRTVDITELMTALFLAFTGMLSPLNFEFVNYVTLFTDEKNVV